MLTEIILKFNNGTKLGNDYLPYNKSILTRILYEQLRK